jgi:hypothetical protein
MSVHDCRLLSPNGALSRLSLLPTSIGPLSLPDRQSYRSRHPATNNTKDPQRRCRNGTQRRSPQDGVFPLPESEARKIHSLPSFPFPCSVIDLCAGRGTALNLITEGAQLERHGIELDTRRAEQASTAGIRIVIAFGPIVRVAPGSLLEGSRSTATAAGSSSRTVRSAETGTGPGISS